MKPSGSLTITIISLQPACCAVQLRPGNRPLVDRQSNWIFCRVFAILLVPQFVLIGGLLAITEWKGWYPVKSFGACRYGYVGLFPVEPAAVQTLYRVCGALKRKLVLTKLYPTKETVDGWKRWRVTTICLRQGVPFVSFQTKPPKQLGGSAIFSPTGMDQIKNEA